ncbi:50S ribosomal protein L19 [Candidatus Giovannonibacteria bacterium RIFCSPHIGHO2_01_FULL_48_47]|nr:MAG: 50S ribosomal protein L19 [Candidatus Giovannonibacteria bacterium RIFCSPHIGHO2_01_FULL_48_47]OGF67776.1 MAG: 50S ribosomal protein L19 [Candidatus Giovannonibacteria bacterium RIFCSPHIGHO2_02_FULL_48_15]OGF88424.1 MAG: 50S ribosomal protein L19 [Candidatus Giovannonibacteria bacterium RIFCSPLOWO2_01_FULL_48_47]OGF94709.1 MAG: 50S ribosomal protein L19 [Candidatus Giovannonibacteria bacterium RIFOXYC1_FULL_48_8]OGF96259.1 MAG: 50S ribosomal protein L19 [Candidatus Giovannonibacteria bac
MTSVLDTKFSPVDIEARKKLDFRAGDAVRVWQKIKEGDPSRKGGAEADKLRSQAFEGLVLARKHGTEPGATFTVRKISEGIGVERIFPLYSPAIEKIEILKRGHVRRAKLYYIREKAAREIRRKTRQTTVAAPQ